MRKVNVILDGHGCWPDIAQLRQEHRITELFGEEDAPNITLAVLEGGMQSGKKSVSIRYDVPDGSVIVAETSLRLLMVAAHILGTAFPEENDAARAMLIASLERGEREIRMPGQ